jgi:hypothetical protein
VSQGGILRLMPPKPVMSRVPDDEELIRLRAEVDRLRELVGPSEESYQKLKLDLLTARDAVIGAQAEVGTARGQQRVLEAEVARLRRNRMYFQRQFTVRLRRYTAPIPVVGRLLDRLSR